MEEDDLNQQRFGALDRLFGAGTLDRLQSSHVAVIGIGGVGSWSAEALARSGVGKITLIDLDDLCITNTNRQLHAIDGQIGRPKVDAMAERIGLVSPDCEVAAEAAFFTLKSAERLLAPGFDCVIDAIDNVTYKADLVVQCRERELPLIVVGAAGGKRDASKIAVSDLAFTTNDRLLKTVRRRLRREYGYPPEQEHVPMIARAVYSTENAVHPQSDGTVCEVNETNYPQHLNCDSGFGAAAFVTGGFGLAAAGEAVRLILHGAE